jgi:HD-like signal output (HDOD) protein
MNILIVDDDFVSRTKMNTLLKDLGSCTGEESSPKALDHFRQALEQGKPFDLVTLDIHMPDMDGTEMLYRIREVEKGHNIPRSRRSKVFMVTAHSDKDSLITCMQAGCDGFIVKPFTRETVLSKLEAIGLIPGKTGPENVPETPGNTPRKRKTIIEEVSEALKGDAVSLPALPDINTQLKELVQNEIDVGQITDLLKKDMLIATSLISLSNSAIFRGVGKNKTLEEAISRLGIDQTFHHVEMLCQRALYSDVSKKYAAYTENLWKHAQSCAYAAQFVGENLNLILSEDPFTLGLVHDIGRLILLQIIGKLEEAGPTGDDVDEEALYTTLDSHHGDFGAALLRKWEFSETFALVAKFHDCPEKCDQKSRELILISFVNVLVKNMDQRIEELAEKPMVEEFCRTFGLNSRALTEIRNQVRNVLKEKGV